MYFISTLSQHHHAGRSCSHNLLTNGFSSFPVPSTRKLTSAPKAGVQRAARFIIPWMRVPFAGGSGMSSENASFLSSPPQAASYEWMSARKLYKVQLRLGLCHDCDKKLYDCYQFVRLGCYGTRERSQIRRKYACEGAFPDPSLLSNW